MFANLANADATEQLDARHMNTALWQTTWGYFLLQMLGVGGHSESPLTDNDIAWVRRHFIEYVRASGPLPTLRVGKQPYGVIPVTSLSAWKPPEGQPSEHTRDVIMQDFLIKLRELWRRQFPSIPRLGRSNDLDADMAAVLSMDGLSSSYAIRNLMGRQYMEHLWVFLSADFFFNQLHMSWQPQPRGPITIQQFRAWFAAQEQFSTAVLNTLGITWRPRLARGVFAPPVATLRGALVQPEPAPKNAPLAPNYIESLLAARDLTRDIRDDKNQPEPPHTLLYLLLRHAMLLEYTTASTQLLIKRGLQPRTLRREPELVGSAAGAADSDRLEAIGNQHHRSGRGNANGVRNLSAWLPSSGEPDLANEPESAAAERVSRQPRAPAIAQRRQARTIASRHARSLFAPAGCVDHLVCDQAPGRHAERRLDRRVHWRLRLGDEPEALGRATASCGAARRASARSLAAE